MTSIVDQMYERMKDDTEQMEESLPQGSSAIRRYFAGKTIFFTGATGFMGKCFVEKVLRDVPELKKLYVLVRQKKGVPPEEKMKKYFQNTIFERLRNMRPNFEDKVVTIRGDLQEAELGLSDEDRRVLIDEVDLWVHNGATTKFDELISVALKINVLATKSMLDLAMAGKRTQSFMYVSTAYSHCYNQDIEEKFYEAPTDMDSVYELIKADEASPNGLPEHVMKVKLGKWPNSYCFTKSLAEELVRQYGETAPFPCAIYRPSIVTCSLSEPLDGWVGNVNGPAYIFMGTGLGAVHITYYQGYPMDLIPADLANNALIASIYDLPERWKAERRGLVYNFGSSTTNPTYLNVLGDYLMDEAPNIGSVKMLWYPFMFFVDKKWLFWLGHVFLHFIPALFADLALLIMGKKPRALSLFWFGTKHLSKVFYFVNGNWRIHMSNTLKLHDKLSPLDQKIFYFDIRNLDWYSYCIRYIRGVRLHILKEPLDNIEKAKKAYQFLKKAHYTTVTILFSLLLYFVLLPLLSRMLSIFF